MKCWICGNNATISRAIGYNANEDDIHDKQKPNQFKRCYCQKCFDEHRKSIEDKKAQMVILKKELMFENAMDILEHQNFDFYKNKEAIDVVEEKLKDDPDKFDSSYEIITAIILVTNRIYSKMQYKVDTYQVDFLLPDHHVILEVDGERHKYNKGRDSVRDENIKHYLGADWEIIRISTDLIKKDAQKIPTAIDKVLEYREQGKVNWNKLYMEVHS